MGGYWIDDPNNPFNQMSHTRGGGGYDNSSTQESNDARAFAMQGAGASALPHFASAGVAAAVNPGGLSVVDGNVIRTTGPGAAGYGTAAGAGGRGSGSLTVATGGPGSGGSGPGARSVLSGGARLPGLPDQRQIRVGELLLFPDERFPDVEEWWEPRYGEPGELVGGIVNMSADGIKNADAAVLQAFADAIIVKPGGIADTVVNWAGWSIGPRGFVDHAVNTAIYGAAELDRLRSEGLPVGGGKPSSAKISRPNAFGFWAENPWSPTPGSDLPNPMSYAPMSMW